ncbi:SusC/RagA family TonB-linked outer membrane protein [Hymenobacter chitinivorans]|uniref:TonB-linked SusC/RagA family outer membrane protein n=1 Tax=Hymenobacter chitinivorans DSM 11115 TaxID=1121954 RepID=A0A2M9BPR7_9BACT|nr:TonB-dependent receptor [Hymenobacter chitinivorans]PJJ59923.1 TonB-linked SusC/RagA family outer membrane protein [Hymenobacter chitinivorans DSM 11115]
MKKTSTWWLAGLATFALPGPLLAERLPALTLAVARPAAVAEWQVTGKVTASNGEALPGVTVVLKGTTRGTTTGPDGSFALAVPETAGTLVFSYIGYQTQEQSFSGATTLSIRLADDAKALEEVVVVGYGTQKKADVTAAIARFDAKQLEERPIARVDQALIGQLAGVQVKQTTGVPGRGFSVQVRGSGSITAGNEPLYVIDGFPLETAAQNAGGRFGTGSPLDNINPNDIESIEVLKDAAAAAIYGSRASNGVVLITTKKGKSGKPRINLNTYAGYSQAVRTLPMLSAEQWVDRATEIINATWVGSGTGRTAAQTTAERMKILGVNTINPTYMVDDRWFEPGHPGLTYVDWEKEAFQKGATQDYQVSASGANDFVNYYVSGDYFTQTGILPGLGYKRYSGRANLDIKATDKLKFGLNLSPSYSVAKDPGVEGKDALIHLLTSITPVVEAEAGLNTNTGDFTSYRWGATRNSPLRQLENNTGETRTMRTLATLYAEYQLVKNLNLRSTLNLDNSDGATKAYSPAFVNGSLGNRQAQGSYNGYRRTTFVNENTLAYSFNLGGNHDFSALVGYAYNVTKLDAQRLTAAGGFVNSAVTTINGAASVSGTANNFTTETRNVLVSYFGRVQYSYLGKYLVSGTVRRDGSSRFGQNQQFGVFPSVSAGWRLSQESFLQSLSALSELKLRASYGLSGNNNIGDYSSVATLGSYGYSFGTTPVNGQAPNRVNNPDLKWEKSQTLDVGVDFGVLKNRLTGSFDYYTKTSKDLLLNVPIPSSAGFTTQLTNVGEVVNKGWELELSSRNLTGAFQWNTAVNLAHNTNKVVHLGQGDAPIQVVSAFDIPNNILQVGQPLYSIYVVKQIGILSQADLDSKAALYGSQTVGDPKYFDANGDGKIDPNDRVIVGHPNPDYVAGITNSFKYKGFDLSVLVQGQWGGSIYSLFGRAIDRTGQGYVDNVPAFYTERWRSADNPGAGERGKAYSTFGRIKNTDWLYSSDYYRVRNITLGYDLGLVIKKSIAQGARIYVTAENFFGQDKYDGGYNPEAVNTDGGDASFPVGVDYGGLPLTKSLVLGLNLTF